MNRMMANTEMGANTRIGAKTGKTGRDQKPGREGLRIFRFFKKNKFNPLGW